jgi:hypothetical protein
VTLTVTDNGGLTSTKSSSVTVTAPTCGGTVLCSGVGVALPSRRSTRRRRTTRSWCRREDQRGVHHRGRDGRRGHVRAVRRGADHRDVQLPPYTTGNNETCTFNAPAAGTYYVNVRAYAAYSGVTLTGTITP